MFGSLLPEEVFVTDGFPEYTYVSIDQGKPERDLAEGLEQENKIISIVGPSKSGKSTLCDKFFGRNVGADKIYVTGGSVTYDNDLWREAYRQVSDDTEKIFEDRAHAEVIEYFVEKELPLIVDDFHYINRDTQISVCRQFKNAASAGLRIVILTVPHRGDDPIRSNPDLTGRHYVEEIDRADVKTRTLRSYQMLSAFHILLNGPPERGSKRLDYELIDASKADVYQILAHVLRLDPPFLQLSLDEIKQRVRSLVKDTREPNIRGALQQIEGIYKDTAPPIEWDDEKRQLTIIDPHFYYYLRNTDAIRRVPKNSDPRQPLLL